MSEVTQVSLKIKTNVDCEVQCNLVDLPPLELLHPLPENVQEEHVRKPPEPLNQVEDDLFEDAVVDDEDYKPYQDLEDDEDENEENVVRYEETISTKLRVFIVIRPSHENS